jgi:hypothetical protein
MNGAKEKAIEAIRSRCMEMGMAFDDDARLETAEESLVRPLSQWPCISEELDRGGGSELKSKYGKRPKFHSLHSSAALCVNAFAAIKEQPEAVQLLGYGPFSVARFEMGLSTGISKPYLDFYLEDQDHVIGIESKYTEWLTPKVPDHDGNLTKYLNRAHALRVVPERFLSEVIEHCISVPEKLFLDVAQLIKHTLGLLARAEETGKRPVLVYVYWAPRNAVELPEYHRHLAETAHFAERITPFLQFHSLSYTELWKALETDHQYRDTVPLLRRRYDISIQ